MRRHVAVIPVLLVLGGCGTFAPTTGGLSVTRTMPGVASLPDQGSDIVLYALGLMDAGYRYGGKNPSAGLDCSGMVSHIFEQAAGLRVTGSAADIARKGKQVALGKMRPGDLVFFNTRNKPHSHVGIFIGDGRFVHAPGSQGKVRADSLTQGWFAARFEEARTYFE